MILGPISRGVRVPCDMAVTHAFPPPLNLHPSLPPMKLQVIAYLLPTARVYQGFQFIYSLLCMLHFLPLADHIVCFDIMAGLLGARVWHGLAWLGSAPASCGTRGRGFGGQPLAGEPTEKSVRTKGGGALAQPPLPHIHHPLKSLNFACRAILEGPKARLWS